MVTQVHLGQRVWTRTHAPTASPLKSQGLLPSGKRSNLSSRDARLSFFLPSSPQNSGTAPSTDRFSEQRRYEEMFMTRHPGAKEKELSHWVTDSWKTAQLRSTEKRE